VKVQPNPQKVNPPSNKAGMENFLAPSPQTKEKIQTNPSTSQPETKNLQISKQPNNGINEETEIVEEIEKKLEKLTRKNLEFSEFSQLIYEKSLKFRLLFIRARLFVLVTDDKRTAIVTVNLPRFGGSGLRYMATNCINQWCQAVTRETSKGKIVTYRPIVSSVSNNDNDDIFD